VNELQKRLQELVDEGKISKETFEEVSTAIKEDKAEETKVEKVDEKVEEKPVLPDTPVDTKKEEADENKEDKAPLPPVPPVDEKVAKEKEEAKEQVQDDKVEKLEKTIEDLVARMTHIEDIVKSLGEVEKVEDKKEIGAVRKPQVDEDDDGATTNSILNRPGMGGINF